jgi:molybdopterin converting factor small subunit
MSDLNHVVALPSAERNVEEKSTFARDVANSFLQVTVSYHLMAQYINTNQESFTLQNPATLLDLLSAVSKRHPTISGMIASMQILINGAPAQFKTILRDGDEIDFIPLVSGG